MAAVQRYVDTNSTAGGDGTTRNHTGSTRAYASLSEWESAEQTDLVTDGDTHTVSCAGGQDSSECQINGWTTGASNWIRVEADRDGSVTDGFYGGSDVLSTSFHHLRVTSGNCVRCEEAHVTIDGLQMYLDHAGNFVSAYLGESDNTAVLRCRMFSPNKDSGQGAIYDHSTINSIDQIFDSNLIVGFGVGIRIDIANFFAPNIDILNNTIYDCTTGIQLTSGASSASATIDVKNNAVADCDTQELTDTTTGAAVTVSYDTNAFERDYGTTNEVDIDTPANDWVSPGATIGSDFHLESGGVLADAGINIGEATDADDVTRAASYDIGCFAFSSASGVTVDVPLATMSLTGQVPTVAGGASIDSPLGTMSLINLVPTVEISAGAVDITVPLATMTLTNNIPGIETGASVDVPVAALTVNGMAPTIGSGTTIDVPLSLISLSNLVPAVETGTTILVPLSSLSITGQVPTVSALDGVNIEVPLNQIAMGAYLPSISAMSDLAIMTGTAYEVFIKQQNGVYQRTRIVFTGTDFGTA